MVYHTHTHVLDSDQTDRSNAFFNSVFKGYFSIVL